MILSEELIRINSIFVDTAPIIYYIEAHPQFGPLAKEVVIAFQSGNLNAYSSVITLAEVLAKPIERGDEKLARKFAEFLKHGKDLTEVGAEAFLTNDLKLQQFNELKVLILKDYL